MKTAVIGGSGLAALEGAARAAAPAADTPYGRASALPRIFDAAPNAVFLNRHGDGHALLPHEINYRANVWLLRELGAETIVAVLTVGGIAADLAVGDFVLPDQLIDYTWGRKHTFSSGPDLFHADFSEPFDPGMRRRLASAATRAGVRCREGGVYGCTQGPRLETAAEIERMARDGCTLVGMTAMPEAGLARELGLPYAGLCMVANPAAGRGGAATLEVADMKAAVAAMRPRLLNLLDACLAERSPED